MADKTGISTNNLVLDNGPHNGTGKAKILPQYLGALAVCLGAVAAGTVIGWPSNITEDLQAGKLHDIQVSDEDKGWIGSIMTVGALLICSPIGYICDLLGRKLAMLLLIIPFSIGWLLIIFANSVGMILAGRFLTGLAGGAFCVSAPLYTSEIAQKEVRGALGSYFQLLLTVGILIAYVLGSQMTIVGYTIVCAVIPLIFGIVFFFQPETPIYLAKKGKDDEALKALRRLRGADYDIDAELRDIKAQLEDDRNTKVAFFQSLKNIATKKAIIIVFGLMFFQQLSGVNAVIMYTSDIFQSAKSSLQPAHATILVGVIQTIATFVSSLVIDKFGRKILLLISGGFMAFSSLLLGIYFSLKDDVKLDNDTIVKLGVLPIISLCLFIIVFSLGYGPIPWMIASEISPAEVKSTIASSGGMFNWFLAFIVSKFYGDLNNVIHGNTFYLFACISTIGTVFVWFACIETKGKSFEEIQIELNGGKTGKAEKFGVENQNFSP